MSNSTSKILAAVGELVLDIATHSDDEPIEGQVAGRIGFSLGGCAPNVALAAQQSGAQARFVGHQGVDAESSLLAETLESSGVQMAPVVRGMGARISIMSGSWGYRAVIAPGDCLQLTPGDFNEKWLDGVGVVHLNSHHFFEPRTEAWFDRVVAASQARSIPRSLDASALNRLRAYGLERFWAKVAEIQPSFLFCSSFEWSFLAERCPPPMSTRPLIVVHRSTDPTLIIHADGRSTEVAVKPVDSVARVVGAGDAMAGGALAAWLAGETDPERFVEAGHARAAHWVSTVPEVPRHRQ